LRGEERQHERDHPLNLTPQPINQRSDDSPFYEANVIEGDAMGSVNKVILVGNLGADPELKYTPSSRPLCNLRIATTEVYKDKSGQRQEKTEWHRVTVWGDQAENCNKYLSKGRSVYIEGRLQTRSYDKDGQKHYATDVVADRVVFLGSGGGGGGGERGGGGGGEGRRQGGGSSRDSGPSDDMEQGPPPSDDDIPF
jgi:single-strand DNA-binding protein